MENKILPDNLSRDECIEYLQKEGLSSLWEEEYQKSSYGIFDPVNPDYATPFLPEAEDLCRLHRLIRLRKVFNVLEFGIGYSTIVMADALEKNFRDYDSGSNKVEVRIRNPFKIYAIDANKHWIDHFTKKYKNITSCFARIEITHSRCMIGEHNGQICHYYKNMPNVVTDFIYLDGPSANDVEGAINGISFQNCPERTVMSGDLLRLEPTFLPGTMILVDGRSNNSRFLKNNFKRQYSVYYDSEQELTAFELLEAPLGKINRAQIEYSLGGDYYNRLSELISVR